MRASFASSGLDTHVQRISALDGIRAASILLVLAAHALPLGPGQWQLNAMSGLMGMSLFFSLSGFLIVTLLSRNADALTFFVRRILRIIPAMLLYVLTMLILFGIGWRAVAENLLFVTNYFYDGRGRGEIAAPMSHLWSLSVEVQFYLAIGLATLILGRRAIFLVPFALIAVTFVRIGAEAHFDIATHLRVDEILSGGTLALVWLYMRDGIQAWLKPAAIAWGMLFVAVLLWGLSCHVGGGWMLYARPYFSALLIGILIHTRFPVIHTLLESRLAAYIARISYALYIWHPLMLWGWMNEGTTAERYLLKRPVSLVLAFLAAHLSTFYWEERWQAFARRLTNGRTAQINA